MALVVSGLVRQVHALSSGGARHAERLGLRPGSHALNVDLLGIRPPAVLLFLSEDCHTCADVLDEAGRLGGDGPRLHALYAGGVRHRARMPSRLRCTAGRPNCSSAQYVSATTPYVVAVAVAAAHAGAAGRGAGFGIGRAATPLIRFASGGGEEWDSLLHSRLRLLTVSGGVVAAVLLYGVVFGPG